MNEIVDVAKDYSWALNNPEAVVAELPDWVTNPFGLFDAGKRAGAPGDGSPLVLDLNGDGIHLSAKDGPDAVYWDIDKDGFREASGWVTGGDGLLAIDKNGNGTIDDNSELFGNDATHATGFEALAAYDSNHDNKITSADAQFANLRAWIDENGDGISQAPELHTLSSLGITSINLAYTSGWQDAGNGNSIQGVSTFVMNGQTQQIVDAWFAYDNHNSVYSSDYTLDVRTLFLPDARGYGNLPDLHIAMSMDDALLTMVQDLSSKTMAQLLDPAFKLDEKIADILYRWAGVQDVDPHSRGDVMDARQYGFLEKFAGDIPSDPTSPISYWGSGAFEEAWKEVLAGFAGRLLMQSGLGSLYDNPSYDLRADGFATTSGTTGIEIYFDTPGQDYLGPQDADNHVYVFRKGIDDGTIHYNSLAENNDTGLDTLLFSGVLPSEVKMWAEYGTLHIRYSPYDQIDMTVPHDPSDYSNVASLERIAFADGTLWDFRNGFLMTDTDDSHVLIGSDQNDVLDGRGGNDQLNGFAGNDTLTGGAGQDNLIGGTGDDTYVFRVGDGPAGVWDSVVEAPGEGTDTIKLTGGILPSNVRMWAEYGVLHIRYSSTDEIVVSAGADSSGASDVGTRVERIVFDNGTVWNLANGLPLTDTDDGHYIYGSAQNDVIDGRGGNDLVYGFAGNDTLTGGTGQDNLQGGTGNDTYIFKVGDSLTSSPDWVYESAGEGVDTIRLTGGILPTAVTLSTSYGSFSIQYSPTDTINISVGYDNITGEVTPYAEKVVFDNGTVWDFRNGITTNGTSAADTIHGTGLKDIINGNGGNDSLYGEGGADTLNGGAGNDLLYGGYGDDKYIYTSGTGMDTIHDDGGAADVISLGSGLTASNITLTRVGQYDMAVLASGQQILLIEGQFTLQGSIETLKYGDGTSLNLLTYSHTLNGTAGNDTLYGTSYGAGGDKINGLDGNDIIYAGAGNDTVTGGNGNDYIYGEDGDDTLSGNAGDDYIYSGTGNDTIIYDSGVDVFADYGGTDTISLTGAGITAANMTLVRPAGNSGDLQVLLNGTLAFTLLSQFYQNDGFETIKFTDGSTFNLSTVQYTTNGTASGETLYGIGFGGNPDDIINGNGGNDSIYALQGNDKITGGTGNDYLSGGDGNDTYFYNAGDGLDTIIDSSGTDTIQIGAGFVKSDLTWQRSGGTNDMNLILKGIEVMTLNSQFLPGQQIETVKFSDGSTQTLTGLQITTNGTDGNDSLSGLMYNASPNDIINGKGGDDYIYGYGGNDTLTGGTGNDYIAGGDGNDTYVYNSGDGLDTISDTSGTDVIKIGAGFVKADLTWKLVNTYDLALYLKGVEVMIVKDHFRDGYAVESVKFADNSTYALTNLALTINGTSGSDSLSGFNSTRDNIKGNAGDDALYGYGGNDTLTGGTGYDYLAGGTGNDTYVFKAGDSPLSNPDYLVEYQNQGTDTIKLTGGILPANVMMWTDPYNLHIRYSATDEINVVSGYDATGSLIGSYVEKITFDNGTVWSLTGGLTLTDTDDTHTVIGSAFADTIDGRGGDDSLYGYGGDDTLIGGTGHDYLAGGTGNDTYVFKTGDSPLANPDYVAESLGEGTDTIRLTGGILPDNVFMWTDIYYLHIRYSPTDEITVTSYYDATGALVSNYVEKIAFDNGTVWDLTQGLPLTDTDDGHSILGSAGNDVIDGRGGNDTIYGYGGNDTIIGGAGDDYLSGGAGDDVYQWGAGAGADYVLEESGSSDKILVTPGLTSENLIYALSGSYDLKITSALNAADNITISGEFNTSNPGYIVEKIEFSDGFSMNLSDYANWISGTSSAETLNGDPGGVTRNDTILGGAGNDAINGKNGSDTISGDAGADTIHGNGGNDFLHGGSGNDILYGDNGNDVLWGGLGADTLTGGAGADRFVFDSSTASSDTIKDFSPTEDILDLSHLISGFDPVTQAITDFVQITDSGANSIVKVDVDGTANGVNFVQVATLQNVTGLTDEAALMNSGHLLAA